MTDPIPDELIFHLDRARYLYLTGQFDTTVHEGSGLSVVLTADGRAQVYLDGAELERYDQWLTLCRLRAEHGTLMFKSRTPPNGKPNFEFVPAKERPRA